MNTNTIKQAIDMQYASIHITPEFHESIIQKTINREDTTTMNHILCPKRFRLVAAAIAVCLGALLLSVPVLGAVSGAFNDMIANYFSKDLARLLMPLETIASQEIEGIRYDIISAVTDEYDIFIELDITDITGKARLKEGFTIDGGPAVSYSGYSAMISHSPEKCRMYLYFATDKPVGKDDVVLFIYGISWQNGNRIGVYEYEYESIPGEYAPLRLSFPAKKAPGRQLTPVTVSNEKCFDISISPFALHLKSEANVIMDPDFNVEVRMSDGKTLIFGRPKEGENHSFSSSSHDNSPYCSMSIIFGQLLDMDSIISVSINGEIAVFE